MRDDAPPFRESLSDFQQSIERSRSVSTNLGTLRGSRPVPVMSAIRQLDGKTLLMKANVRFARNPTAIRKQADRRPRVSTFRQPGFKTTTREIAVNLTIEPGSFFLMPAQGETRRIQLQQPRLSIDGYDLTIGFVFPETREQQMNCAQACTTAGPREPCGRSGA